MQAFVPSSISSLGLKGGHAFRRQCDLLPANKLPIGINLTRRCNPIVEIHMAAKVDDKLVVQEYFNGTGFDRWNRIYSEDGKVNNVQQDIRDGHAATVQKILTWIDEDGDASGMMVADAGCGVGSLAIPLAERGAIVSASDISQSMVDEARRRGEQVLGSKVANCTFSVSDLENLSGKYHTVVCVDVMIHYPSEKVAEMMRHLSSLAESRLIISFAPKTLALSILKKIGDFFPGPSKATRAYLHEEAAILQALKQSGWSIGRTEFSGTKFYFSRIIEAVKN